MKLKITGGSIVTLNIISSSPRIRCATVQFMMSLLLACRSGCPA
jgi:hypothetical protein